MEDPMPSEHDKIDRQKVIASLNTILELELAGVVRYLHYSLMVFGYTTHSDHRLDAQPGHGGHEPRFDGRRARKSTRLNSSHLVISYAVFCLKKKKNTTSPN